MTTEDIMRASLRFQNKHWGVRPNVVRIHPETYLQLRLTASTSPMFMLDVVTAKPRIYDMEVIQDTRLSIGEATVGLEEPVEVRVLS